MEDFLEKVSFRLNHERSIESGPVGIEEGTPNKENSVDRGNESRKPPNMYAAWSSSGWLNPKVSAGKSFQLRLKR